MLGERTDFPHEQAQVCSSPDVSSCMRITGLYTNTSSRPYFTFIHDVIKLNRYCKRNNVHRSVVNSYNGVHFVELKTSAQGQEDEENPFFRVKAFSIITFHIVLFPIGPPLRSRHRRTSPIGGLLCFSGDFQLTRQVSDLSCCGWVLGFA